MPGKLLIQILERQQVLWAEELDGAIELGRQNSPLEQLFTPRRLDPRSGPRCWRIAIAGLEQDSISRQHAHLESLSTGQVRLTNRSAKVPLGLVNPLGELPHGASCELTLPTEFSIGQRTVRVVDPSQPVLEAGSARDSKLCGLETLLAAPGRGERTLARFPSLSADSGQMESLVRWLQTTLEVLQSAANSSDFFPKAAKAVVDLVGLDSGRVLVREGENWQQVAVATASSEAVPAGWRPSRTVLDEVTRQRRTFWQGPGETKSLQGIDTVVAAPILDRNGSVIGALYGECREDLGQRPVSRLTKVEAMLVELLASSVANGLARLEQEKAILEADVRFKQFFTPELSRQLALHPDLLAGQDCEVTMLFCDIRGFSRISDRLGPAGTVEWISAVMTGLSDCVLAHRGVLVDYIGDELLAMWGAPERQDDHARLACRAALDMLALLPKMNAQWQEKLGEPLAVGIGINTGQARVGNTGSRHKFKYGPLGHAVNLASRVQGATKYLRCKLLITEFTQAKLGPEFHTRRLGKVRVVNIARPVDLYELTAPEMPGWAEIKTSYESALDQFERGKFRESSRALGQILGPYPDDGPTLILIHRAVACLVTEPVQFDPVWDLPGK